MTHLGLTVQALPGVGGFDWIQALLTLMFGALAGGLTNRIAVWMLFHPYESPHLFGRPVGWLQGAIPKNQKRLASTIGKVVGNTLLTPEDMTAELQDEELRQAFDGRIRELLVELVEGEQPALSDLLPESALPEVRRLIQHVLGEMNGQILRSVESPEFQQEAGRILANLAETLEDETLAETLDEDRVAELRGSADEWLGQLLDSDAFERTVRRHLGHAAEHLLRPGRTLEELIPAGLVSAVEHAINDYLPLAMERLGRLLEDPSARERVENTLHRLLDRFMQDLKFHQRVVAKLIITEESVDNVLRTVEEEGTEQLSELLKETEVQAAMARNVNDAIVEFLRRPTTRVLGKIGDDQVESGLESLSEWVVRSARDPSARRFLLEQLEEAVWRLGEKTWADVLRLLPAERVGSWLGFGLRSEPGKAILDQLNETITDRLLNRPIGQLNRFLKDDAAVRLADSLGPQAWEWVMEQVPEVAERIKIAERIEGKIEAYPVQEVEELVRTITQRELNLIIRLGYILGAVIGTVLVIVNQVIPW
jgi:uncharacterized membrane protein YheB (UPF0754 family)